MKRPISFLAMCLMSISVAFGQGVPLEQWAHNHPEASKALGEWVKNHPPAAHKLFEWDAAHPERSQGLVNWAIMHPREKFRAFMAMHHDWPELEDIAAHHEAAFEDFLFWSRNHAEAAKALMAHSAGLAWAGNHLFKEYWNMETPRK